MNKSRYTKTTNKIFIIVDKYLTCLRSENSLS